MYCNCRESLPTYPDTKMRKFEYRSVQDRWILLLYTNVQRFRCLSFVINFPNYSENTTSSNLASLVNGRVA